MSVSIVDLLSDLEKKVAQATQEKNPWGEGTVDITRVFDFGGNRGQLHLWVNKESAPREHVANLETRSLKDDDEMQVFKTVGVKEHCSEQAECFTLLRGPDDLNKETDELLEAWKKIWELEVKVTPESNEASQPEGDTATTEPEASTEAAPEGEEPAAESA